MILEIWEDEAGELVANRAILSIIAGGLDVPIVEAGTIATGLDERAGPLSSASRMPVKTDAKVYHLVKTLSLHGCDKATEDRPGQPSSSSEAERCGRSSGC